MAFSQGPQDDGAPMADINVTPLVDVMLVLLIVFMVAAPMMVVGVPVDLPRTAAPRAAAQSPPLVLSVDREGKLFLRQEPVAEADLAARVRAEQADHPDRPVYVRGDRAAPYGLVLRAMGLLSQAGIARVALIAEADPAAPATAAR
jgi:biopolymer transport protein TolR